MEKLGLVAFENAIQGMKLPTPPAVHIDKLASLGEANLASQFRVKLIEMMNDFDDSLDKEHEVGLRVVSLGNAVLHVQDIGYYNPSLIVFNGTMTDGNKVQLIQHVSQIDLALISVKRLNPDEPKRPIGFHTCGKSDEGVTDAAD